MCSGSWCRPLTAIPTSLLLCETFVLPPGSCHYPVKPHLHVSLTSQPHWVYIASFIACTGRRPGSATGGATPRWAGARSCMYTVGGRPAAGGRGRAAQYTGSVMRSILSTWGGVPCAASCARG